MTLSHSTHRETEKNVEKNANSMVPEMPENRPAETPLSFFESFSQFYFRGVKKFETKEGPRCRKCRKHFRDRKDFEKHLDETGHFKAYL
jgi:hypothetical protein